MRKVATRVRETTVRFSAKIALGCPPTVGKQTHVRTSDSRNLDEPPPRPVVATRLPPSPMLFSPHEQRKRASVQITDARAPMSVARQGSDSASQIS